ncbi:chitinase [Streptomyces youssoufiensis]
MVRARSGISRSGLLGSLAAAALVTAGFVAPAQAGAAEPAASAQAGPAASARAAVPPHAVTGYWQNFDNGATVQKLSDVQDEYDIIAVAFADATGKPGAVDFTLDPALDYTEEQFKADIKAKQAAGKSVIISVGGEKGAVSVSDDASADAFATSISALMDEYGFDGVDIDLENGLNSTYMTKALKAIHAAHSGLVVTMAPQTVDMQSPRGEYFKTALAIKDFLTVVNMQYYNSGSMLGCDGKVYSQGTVDFLTGLACIQLENGLDPSQVGLGVPASPRAAGGGYAAPSVVNAALDCLTRGTSCGTFKPEKTYPGLRGAMTWSTNWDASNGDEFSSQVGKHVHGLP